MSSHLGIKWAGLFAAAVSLGLGSLPAHDIITTKITWTREVSRLVYKRCASCHREGGTAFSLTTYEAARPWAVAIKEEVLQRRMPPWGAVKGFGEFRNDQGLTQEELDLIANWVEGGAPQGEVACLPPNRRFADQPLALKPDRSTPLAFHGDLTLKQPVELIAIRPGSQPSGSSVQVYASRPDGSAEPLIWLNQSSPATDRTFYFRQPLRLPAGTQILASSAASFTLFVATNQRK